MFFKCVLNKCFFKCQNRENDSKQWFVASRQDSSPYTLQNYSGIRISTRETARLVCASRERGATVDSTANDRLISRGAQKVRRKIRSIELSKVKREREDSSVALPSIRRKSCERNSLGISRNKKNILYTSMVIAAPWTPALWTELTGNFYPVRLPRGREGERGGTWEIPRTTLRMKKKERGGNKKIPYSPAMTLSRVFSWSTRRDPPALQVYRLMFASHGTRFIQGE